MKSHHLSFFVLILSLPLIFSCEKHRAKKLSGTYACSVHYEYWDMSPKTIDSVYTENLSVEQDGKNLLVLGATIPVAEVSKGKVFEINSTHTSFKLYFKDKQIYLKGSSGGLGGKATRTYTGTKVSNK